MTTKILRNAVLTIPRTLAASLRTITLLALDTVTLALSSVPSANSARQQQALLIRLDYIGDFLLWLPSARTISKQLRAEGKRVVFVCNPPVRELALQENIFDEVIPLNREMFKNSLSFRTKFLWKIRAQQWALVINPTFSREPLFADSIVRFAYSSRKIGFHGDSANTLPWALSLSKRWYSELVDGSPLHELEKNEKMMRQSLGEACRVADYSRLSYDGKTINRFSLPQSFAVLFPGVSWEGKKWPLEHFVEVGRHLQKNHRMHVVLLGAPHERDDATRIARELDPELTKNHAGETSLAEMIAILGEADLLVSNDTSAVHAAALSRVACVAIVGGGHFGRFLPYPKGKFKELSSPSVAHAKMECYGCAWRCIHPRKLGEAVVCVQNVSLRTVVDLLESSLVGQSGGTIDSNFSGQRPLFPPNMQG